MAGGRPPGPLRSYAVDCVWPSDPARYRQAVRDVDERTARKSARTLAEMHYAFQVKVSFFQATADRKFLGEVVAAQWDRLGRVTYAYEGEFSLYIPLWAQSPGSLNEETRYEPVVAGS